MARTVPGPQRKQRGPRSSSQKRPLRSRGAVSVEHLEEAPGARAGSLKPRCEVAQQKDTLPRAAVSERYVRRRVDRLTIADGCQSVPWLGASHLTSVEDGSVPIATVRAKACTRRKKLRIVIGAVIAKVVRAAHVGVGRDHRPKEILFNMCSRLSRAGS